MRICRARARTLPVVLACLLALVVARPAAAQDTASAAAALQSALRTQAATQTKLSVLGDAFTCPDARLVSYRRSDAQPGITDAWYVASQEWADAALLRLSSDLSSAPGAASLPAINASDTTCHLQKGFVFLDRLWSYDLGGYYPDSNPVGTQVDQSVRYADDNALAGLALLEAAQTSSLSDDERAEYVYSAEQEAAFLTTSGLWDNTFGGGFWWTTNKGDTPEGKPAQTNAIAALLFGRLYQATGNDTYRTWALQTLLWMDTYLYDPSRSLYRWSVAYANPATRSGSPVASSSVYDYDNGIAIEAQLVAASLDGDPSRLPKAEAIGHAIQAQFWVPDRGYALTAGISQIYTSYSAWTSLGHLALYDADGDPAWLALAQANADALSASVGEPDGGYGLQQFSCTGSLAHYCQPGQTGWVIDHIRDTAAQAWSQRLQIELARRAAFGPASSPRAAGA